jgi:hypothetical protein
MDMVESARGITDRQTLAEFVLHMRDELAADGGGWENPTLDRFLEALAAWCTDAEATMVDQPSWSLVAEMLGAASMYE